MMEDMEEMEFFNYVFDKIKDSKDIKSALNSLNLGELIVIINVSLEEGFIVKYCVVSFTNLEHFSIHFNFIPYITRTSVNTMNPPTIKLLPIKVLKPKKKKEK